MKKDSAENRTYRKSKWRWLCLPVGIVSLLVILAGGITNLLTRIANLSIHSLGVIGGADGPTAIFISATPGTDGRSLVVSGILMLMSILGFYKLSHLKK